MLYFQFKLSFPSLLWQHQHQYFSALYNKTSKSTHTPVIFSQRQLQCPLYVQKVYLILLHRHNIHSARTFITLPTVCSSFWRKQLCLNGLSIRLTPRRLKFVSILKHIYTLFTQNFPFSPIFCHSSSSDK